MTISADDLWRGANGLAAASLGASFYVLRTAEPFLVNRSFDPKYNGIYVLRFITGLVGGTILAAVVGPTLRDSLGKGPGASLTPGVLALLGGYAVEAVEQVLQRLVEILLSVIRGDGSSQAQADATAKDAKKTAAVQEDLAGLEVELNKAAPNSPAALDALKKVRETLKRDWT
jgi:hypothetical protein